MYVAGKSSGTKYVRAIGRRKTATAVVRLVRGKFSDQLFIVNGKPIHEYWPGESLQTVYMEPFRITNMIDQYTGNAIIHGSGRQGQLGAFTLAAARALEKIDPEKFRPLLKKRGLLTRDARERERRKFGLAQKARAKKQSPKR